LVVLQPNTFCLLSCPKRRVAVVSQNTALAAERIDSEESWQDTESRHCFLRWSDRRKRTACSAQVDRATLASPGYIHVRSSPHSRQAFHSKAPQSGIALVDSPSDASAGVLAPKLLARLLRWSERSRGVQLNVYTPPRTAGCCRSGRGSSRGGSPCNAFRSCY